MRIKDIIPGNLVSFKPSYSSQRRIGVIVVAPIHISLGERDLAVAWLDKQTVICERIEHLDVIGLADPNQVAIAATLLDVTNQKALERQHRRDARAPQRHFEAQVRQLVALSALTL